LKKNLVMLALLTVFLAEWIFMGYFIVSESKRYFLTEIMSNFAGESDVDGKSDGFFLLFRVLVYLLVFTLMLYFMIIYFRQSHLNRKTIIASICSMLFLAAVVGAGLGNSWLKQPPFNKATAIKMANEQLKGLSDKYTFWSAAWEKRTRSWIIRYRSNDSANQCFKVRLERESTTTYYNECEVDPISLPSGSPIPISGY